MVPRKSTKVAYDGTLIKYQGGMLWQLHNPTLKYWEY